MKTFITDNENLKAMTKAIRKAGFTLETYESVYHHGLRGRF